MKATMREAGEVRMFFFVKKNQKTFDYSIMLRLWHDKTMKKVFS
jgi:hypothetical protein